MKSIINFISERLQIGGSTKVVTPKKWTDTEIDDLIDKYNGIGMNPQLRSLLNHKTPQSQWTHYQKMEGYMKKGSKPERLVKSIKDKEKLIKRWQCGMDLGWKEAADTFKKEIIDRGYFTEEELMTHVTRLVKANREKYRKIL